MLTFLPCQYSIPLRPYRSDLITLVRSLPQGQLELSSSVRPVLVHDYQLKRYTIDAECQSEEFRNKRNYPNGFSKSYIVKIIAARTEPLPRISTIVEDTTKKQ
jgi:hypothetical protein